MLEILYEDRDLLVVDKPSGLAVQPGAGVSKSVLDVLGGTKGPLLLVHRLDQATSGVLVLAKSKAVAAELGAAWSLATKRYLAIVAGDYEGPTRIEHPLPGKDRRPQSATTAVLEKVPLSALEPAASLLTLEIETGRMHQIRRHLSMVGHPVLLDDKYGDFPVNRQFLKAAKGLGLAVTKKRLLLHASAVRLRGARSLAVESPVPELFRQLVGFGKGGVC